MWLHVPGLTTTSPASASAPAAEPLTLESDSPYHALASSATWREKSLPPASWRRALSKAGWTTRLSGLTLPPSTLDRGAAAWTSSLAAFRASRTPTRASDSERPMSETSGLSSQDWYTTFRRDFASSRTFQASLLTTTESYDQTYRPWATRLRRESSQRRRSARLIFASASSSSEWQTPTGGGHHNRQQQGQTVKEPLPPDQATAWQTPSVADTKGGHMSRSGERSSELLLRGQAKAWRTPNAGTVNNIRGGGQDPAKRAAQGHQVMLQDQVTTWATPMANDGVKPSAGNRAVADLSHQAQQIETDGQTGSPTGRVLNPRFVEMLMGWPVDLTS